MTSEEMRNEGNWEEHHHEALVHTHPHYHVTHNYKDGGFQHLSSEHEHEHDHSEMTHSHYPHEDFDKEHRDEAHVHDHDMPVREVRKKTTAKKTTTAKKK